MVQKVIATELASNVAKNKATPYIIGGVILVSIGLTYFGIVRPLFCKFGVLDCGKTKEEIEFYELDAFNPQIASPNNISISYDLARKLAIQIHDALGYGSVLRLFDDDEDAVYGALRSAGSVADLSLVSKMYASIYNESLVARLTSKLNSSELDKVKSIIKNFKR